MRTIAKIWRTGNSLVVVVPASWIEYYNLKVGDGIDLELHSSTERQVKK